MLRLMRRCGKGMSGPPLLSPAESGEFCDASYFYFLLYWAERTEAFVLAQRFRFNWGNLVILMDFALGGCVCDFY